MIDYETASSYDRALLYHSETAINTTDDGYTLAYVGGYGVFPGGTSRTERPLDVARLFWERFARPLNEHRR